MSERVVKVARSQGLARSSTTPWELVLRAVVRQGGVRLRDLCSRNRSRRATLARHLAMYLGRKLTPLTLAEIGSHLGGRDHSTVLYGVQRIEQLLEQRDEVVAAMVAEVERAISPQTTIPEWSLDVVDPVAGPPTLRLTYRRPDGTRWGASLPMELLD